MIPRLPPPLRRHDRRRDRLGDRGAAGSEIWGSGTMPGPRWIPRTGMRTGRLWTDVVRQTQPGHVGAPASLLALAAWQSGHGAIQARPTRNGERQHDFAKWPPRPSTVRHG